MNLGSLCSWLCSYHPPGQMQEEMQEVTNAFKSQVISSAEGFWICRWIIIAVPRLPWKSPFIPRPGGMNAHSGRPVEKGFDCLMSIHYLPVHRRDLCLYLRCWKRFIIFCCLWYVLLSLCLGKGPHERQLRISFLWQLMVFGASFLILSIC